MLTADVPRIGKISRLVFGCASVGGRVSESASLRAMAAAFAGGVTTFDIARSYGYGDAERILGGFLRGRRQQAQIVTKAGVLPAPTSHVRRAAKSVARAVFSVLPSARQLVKPALGAQRSSGHFTPAALEQSLLASLRALGTDYVDGFLLHACDESVLEQDETLEAMANFVARGMARRVGVASGAAEALRWLERGADATVELSAKELLELSWDKSTIELALANQPLGGGELLRSTQQTCSVRGLDPGVGLELLLHRPLQRGATGVVVSMLSARHVEQALAAFTAPQLSDSQRMQLSSELFGDRESPPRAHK